MDGRQGAAGSRGAQAEVTSARPYGQALGRAPDYSALIIESGLGWAAAVVAVAERCACEGHTDDRTLVRRLQGARRWMLRRPVGDRQIVLALHKGRESCDILTLGCQSTRIVAGVAAHIFRCDLDAAFADGGRPE